jgi:hypothetical protein
LQLKTNGKIQELGVPEALHSTARKGAAIRAIHIERLPLEDGDKDSSGHVTLLFKALRGTVRIVF